MHPLRNALTCMGIVAGVSAVVMVTAVVEGARTEVRHSIAELGAGRISVESGSMDANYNATLLFGGLYQLRHSDVQHLQSGLAARAQVTGLLRGVQQVSAGRRSANAAWIGGNEAAATILGYKVRAGREFSKEEGAGFRRLVLLGHGTAEKLLGEQARAGGRVRIAGTSFDVVGILEPRGISFSGQPLDDVVLVPLGSARRILLDGLPIGHDALQQIAIRMASDDDLEANKLEIESLLAAGRRVTRLPLTDHQVVGVAETVRAANSVDATMALLLAMVAAICLTVGGIGVMNIMLVSVSERTGEIGLRMALGASPMLIRWQFVLESLCLSLLGGVLGLLVGAGGARLISVAHDMPMALNGLVLLVSFVVTLAVGLLSAAWPAHVAARMRPSEALRRL